MKMVSILALVAICIFTSGCMNGQDNQNGRQTGQGNQTAQQTRQNNQRTDVRQPAQDNAAGNMDNQIRVADAAATKITQLPGIQSANVLITRRNAYVAAVMNNGGQQQSRNGGQQLSRKMEDRIAQQVRSIDPNVQNVYVSTNPDFVDRINAYVSDVQQGRPVAGFIEQFNEMVQRIFPDAR